MPHTLADFAAKRTALIEKALGVPAHFAQDGDGRFDRILQARISEVWRGDRKAMSGPGYEILGPRQMECFFRVLERDGAPIENIQAMLDGETEYHFLGPGDELRMLILPRELNTPLAAKGGIILHDGRFEVKMLAQKARYEWDRQKAQMGQFSPDYIALPRRG